MKIAIENYNSDWIKQFTEIKQEIESILVNMTPVVEHIGSTSIPNLAAKPIIDILVGVSSSNLDKSAELLLNKEYIYFEKYSAVMPYRRFFVKLKKEIDPIIYSQIYHGNDEIPNELNNDKLAHVHVLEHQSFHWIRHIAFRDYLRNHPDIVKQYEQLKRLLSLENWKDGNEYNNAKDIFIKEYEFKAVQWFKEKYAHELPAQRNNQ